MKCRKCDITMRKRDKRNEVAEMDGDVTDGQLADYVAAESSGDNGNWNLGIIEYECGTCKSIVQVVNDQLPDYYPLIRAWHSKAAEGDCFVQFVFQYLAFIAHIKNNLFYMEIKDRKAIQSLKVEHSIRDDYFEAIRSNSDLADAWNELIRELEQRPLHNNSIDQDYPEIDGWWNNSSRKFIQSDEFPEGRVLSLDDWQNMVEFWYSIRNNLFHGGKNPNIERDVFLVERAFRTLRPLMESELSKSIR